jgi:DNA-binding MarR family transcriptional regulator
MDSEKTPKVDKPAQRDAEIRRTKTLMRRLIVELRSRLDDELRVKNITTSQLRFLHEVKVHPGSSGAQLARACYITPQSAQAMMARAVERGWIVRGSDTENHRLVTLRLTPAGERLLAYADGVLSRLEAEVWSGVTFSELRGMNEVIERGLENLGQ